MFGIDGGEGECDCYFGVIFVDCVMDQCVLFGSDDVDGFDQVFFVFFQQMQVEFVEIGIGFEEGLDGVEEQWQVCGVWVFDFGGFGGDFFVVMQVDDVLYGCLQCGCVGGCCF